MDTVKIRSIKRKIRSLVVSNRDYPSRYSLLPETKKRNEEKIKQLKEELEFEYDRLGWN